MKDLSFFLAKTKLLSYPSPSDAGTGSSLSLAHHLNVVVNLVLVYRFGSSHERRRLSDKNFHNS
jgi:hypothetical protein